MASQLTARAAVHTAVGACGRVVGGRRGGRRGGWWWGLHVAEGLNDDLIAAEVVALVGLEPQGQLVANGVELAEGLAVPEG